jgi:uncharacterized repeat protein (TIGR01451 family)
MKKSLLLLLSLFIFSFTQAQQPFVTTWEVTADDLDIMIPTNTDDYTYDYTVDFGDGTILTNQTDDVIYSYSNPGIYTVSIQGLFPHFNGRELRDIPQGIDHYKRIISIDQWGDNQWSSMEEAFIGCFNLEMNANDLPNLTQVISLRAAFAGIDFINQSISNWNVSNIQDMSYLFANVYYFDQPLNNWDMSNVITIEQMFRGAGHFNQPLDNWNVSNVTNMSNTFAHMFYNQNINNWDVSSVTDMSGMFKENSDFNQPLNNWDVSNVTTLSEMFYDCDDFNQPLNSWNVSSVINMSNVFYSASKFNMPLNNWDVSNVENMEGLFNLAVQFNQPLDNWDVSNVTNMESMLSSSSFNQNINNWNVSNVSNMSRMFEGAGDFDQPLNNWDVSNVTNMLRMFNGAYELNQPLNNWDVSSVITMSLMFRDAFSFNQPINNWNTSSLNSMSFMFHRALAFNQPLDNWDVSNVAFMESVFMDAESFNKPLNNWIISNVQTIKNMFKGATSFNRSLDSWDITNIVYNSNFSPDDLVGVFDNATSFDQDLSDWDFMSQNLSNFIDNTNMSSENYDALIQKLVSLNLDNGNLGAENIQFCNTATRQQLINNGWTITDGGPETGCDANSISGFVLYDELNDGCDQNDLVIENHIINVFDGMQNTSYSIMDNGYYEMFVAPGNYTLSILNLGNNFSSSPSSININIAGQNEILENIDFCITANQQFEDLAINFFPLEDAIPGFETDYQIIVSNNGTQTVPNIQVSFGYDESFQNYVSSTVPNSGTSTDILNFQLTNLEPFSQEVFELTLLNVVPPTLNSGDVLSFTTSVSPDANDTTTEDNTIIYEQTVVNSYDPNDKMVVQGDQIEIDDTDQYLDYRIRFQNLGTANALNVKITDTIHPNLDWTTFQPITSSHDYRIEIVDGEQINYYFDNINLPFETADLEGSNGYITYKIKPKSNVQIGDTFENTAYIYFDFNLPIITNTVVTTVVEELSTDAFDSSQIRIYPNPVSDRLNIELPSGLNLNSVELFDIQGNLVKVFKDENVLDLSSILSGIYILKMETDQGSYHQKIIRQ